MKKKAIFLFHRDLRLFDNTGLHQCAELGVSIIPIFIFDDRQVKHNSFASSNAIEFMVVSLHDLDKQLGQYDSRLFVFEGISHTIIDSLLSSKEIMAVYSNMDYTPFARQRDSEIEAICKKHNVNFKNVHDALLLEPASVKTAKNKPYTVFTPFYKKAMNIEIRRPRQTPNTIQFYQSKHPLNFPIEPIDNFNTIFKKYVPAPNPKLAQKGGRTEALKIVRRLEEFSEYERTKDIPSIHGTLRISAHLKFGTISVRELFYELEDRLGAFNPIIRQLY